MKNGNLIKKVGRVMAVMLFIVSVGGLVSCGTPPPGNGKHFTQEDLKVICQNRKYNEPSIEEVLKRELKIQNINPDDFNYTNIEAKLGDRADIPAFNWYCEYEIRDKNVSDNKTNLKVTVSTGLTIDNYCNDSDKGQGFTYTIFDNPNDPYSGHCGPPPPNRRLKPQRNT